jgi:CheY-like chemotaxis protein
MGSSGTGLGLAVVWGTVQDHGGVIDVQSVNGGGTTFDIYFPAIRQELSLAKDKVPLESYRGRDERILVVDDINMQCEIASKMLEKLGYAVHTVNSGEAAVECVKQNTFDLIVLDMIMGEGMDGLDTYRCLIAQHPSQKAVITSGFSENERVKEAQRLGAGAYIKKPFRIETLGVAVRFELDKHDE